LLGAVHKRRLQSGGRGLSSVDNERGGYSDADAHTFLVQKTLDFSKFMVRLHGQGGRGLSFCRQGGGRSRFCADVFYGRPLPQKCSWRAFLFHFSESYHTNP